MLHLDLELWLFYRNHKRLFEVYQADQSRDVFNCDQIISCIQNDFGVVVIGLYRVAQRFEGVRHREIRALDAHCLPGFSLTDSKPTDGGYVYELVELPGFDDISERVVIDWGPSDRAWHQWYSSERDKDVVEILPHGYVMEWPGFMDILIDWADLSRLLRHPHANRHWINPLSSVSGIYLITNRATGDLYVGSATGENGIWGRWAHYAEDGHGGNIMLRQRMAESPLYHHNLRYSLLHILPRNIGQNEALHYERLYKEKLGSRAFGLNLN